MRFQAFPRMFHVFFFARWPNRNDYNVVVMGQFRNAQGQFNVCFIYQMMTMFRVDFPIQFQVQGNRYLFSNVRYFLNVGTARTFFMNFNGGQGQIIASRHVHFFAPWNPSKWVTLYLVLFSRQVSGTICSFKCNRDVREVNNSMNVPGQGDEMVGTQQKFCCQVFNVTMSSIRIDGVVELCRYVMRANVRVLRFVQDAYCLSTTRMAIPTIFYFLSYPIRIPIDRFFLRVLVNAICASYKSDSFRRRLFIQFRIRTRSRTFSFFHLFR